MRRCLLFVLASILYVPYSFAQEFSQAIEDNSYFIEEAYNQEFRVVQHSSTGYYQSKTKNFVYTFTQEWPIGGGR
jgi:archaellum component FlaF (FlaF/FlaG flagellin family)